MSDKVSDLRGNRFLFSCGKSALKMKDVSFTDTLVRARNKTLYVSFTDTLVRARNKTLYVLTIRPQSINSAELLFIPHLCVSVFISVLMTESTHLP